ETGSTYVAPLPKRVINPSPTEDYLVSTNGYPFYKEIRLKTLTTKGGSGDYVWKVTVNQSPWVLSYGVDRSSALASSFNIIVAIESEYNQHGGYTLGDLLIGDWIWSTYGVGYPNTLVIPKSGKFIVKIVASGINWQLRIGVE
ncbi:MAG: hypothetical protein Q8P00_01700, partial [Dehalococcoidia bacterium]|nr:hypothetical protein [Dehalococcoidia bacterium]